MNSRSALELVLRCRLADELLEDAEEAVDAMSSHVTDFDRFLDMGRGIGAVDDGESSISKLSFLVCVAEFCVAFSDKKFRNSNDHRIPYIRKK